MNIVYTPFIPKVEIETEDLKLPDVDIQPITLSDNVIIQPYKREYFPEDKAETYEEKSQIRAIPQPVSKQPVSKQVVTKPEVSQPIGKQPVIEPPKPAYTPIAERKHVNQTLNDLLNLFDKHGFQYKITSGLREGAKTSNGAQSWHATGSAMDIVPINGMTYQDFKDRIQQSQEIQNYFRTHKLGILDETTPEMLARTGGSGDHWHIGPDQIALKTFREWYGKMGGKLPIFQSGGKYRGPLQDSLKKYKQNWSQQDINHFLTTFENHDFTPQAILSTIQSESGFNPKAKSPYSSATGLFQFTQATAKDLLGSQAAQEYATNSRSLTNQINDGKVLIDKINKNIKSERDKLTYGRLKVNLLAPNLSLDTVIPDSIWNNSLSEEIKKRLTPGKSMIRDLMNVYDSGLLN